jgi:hypothetical protein
MRHEDRNRHYFFCRPCCPYMELAAVVFTANCYGPILDRNGRHSTRLLMDTCRDTDPALV